MLSVYYWKPTKILVFASLKIIPCDPQQYITFILETSLKAKSRKKPIMYYSCEIFYIYVKSVKIYNMLK